ncbi:MAG: hypothetical protein MUF18_19000 [Fimbriiglobus sp.]|nr:hypothetical protein [Fimbriiglobus sp.]
MPRPTRIVLPALLLALAVGCGKTTTPEANKDKGSGTTAKSGASADPKAAEAAKKFAADFLASVRDKKANPEQLTPEFKKVLGDAAPELAFLATEVAADEVTAVAGPDGSAFAIGRSKIAPRTLLRLAKSGSDFKVDWISVGVKGVSDATLTGEDAPAQFAAQAFLDAIARHKAGHASALLTDSARNTLGKSPFGGFDQGALKNKFDELIGGLDKYTVTGTSKGTITAELPFAGGKKTATIKTAKGSRPGEWLVDGVEVK